MNGRRVRAMVRRNALAQVRNPGHWFLLFVLGRYSAGQTSSPTDLLPFLNAHDGQYPWAMCAFGPQENACAITAAGQHSASSSLKAAGNQPCSTCLETLSAFLCPAWNWKQSMSHVSKYWTGKKSF